VLFFIKALLLVVAVIVLLVMSVWKQIHLFFKKHPRFVVGVGSGGVLLLLTTTNHHHHHGLNSSLKPSQIQPYKFDSNRLG